MKESNEIKRYKRVLKSKGIEDYSQWESSMNEKIKVMCSHIIYNKIKIYEYKIENEYASKSTSDFRGNYISILILGATMLITALIALVGNLLNPLSNLGEKLTSAEDIQEFINEYQKAAIGSYDIVVGVAIAVFIFIGICLIVLEIHSVRNRKNEVIKVSFYKDMIRLLKNENEKRKSKDEIGTENA